MLYQRYGCYTQGMDVILFKVPYILMFIQRLKAGSDVINKSIICLFIQYKKMQVE